ncbi:MAG: hypothetical protein AAGA54_12745 [Myxococcota bacterium]
MMTKRFALVGGGLSLLFATGCPDPCLDDGLLQDDPAGCPVATGNGDSDTENATESDPDPTETDTSEDTCANGVLDGDETDVDCGGSCNNLCGDGDNCGGDADCASGNCGDDGTCTPEGSSCDDGVQNGDETDVDCGGSCPAGCGGGEGCQGDDDCASNECTEDDVCTGENPPACDDGMQNGDETDVDCGGACDPCGPGDDCDGPEDCDSGVCEGGTCAEPSCDDGVQNGDETGLDCGGDTCEGCPPGGGCDGPEDCASGVCNEDGTCAPPACDDGVQNGDETDLDCGGSCGSTCEPGEGCTLFLDCVQLVCDEATNTCADPTCSDGAANGNETDVDCGGPDCPACDEPGFCNGPDDCQSMLCDDGQCVAPECNDEMQNGTETGVDCGGECAPCDDGDGCSIDDDCVSLNCDEGTCVAPTCDDGIQNQGESDVDCGGPNCDACDDGETCNEPADCDSGTCTPLGICVSPGCTDGVQNGDETDVDCGGGTCGPCDDGETCEENADCLSEVCIEMGNVCAAPSCDDGITNGNETDIDCGGPDCDACDDGDDCILSFDCMSLVCLGDECQEASCNDGVQNGDETGVDCGGSCLACPTGGGCDDGADCESGVCDPATNTCSAPTCDDMVQNGDETDVDCGGDVCGPCDDGEGCEDAGDCVSGVCDGDANTCSAPTCDDMVQNGDETDVDCGGDVCGPCNPGDMCIDGDDCSSAGCTGGVCNDLLAVAATPACSDADGGPVTLDAVGSGGTGGPYTYAWTPDDGSLDSPNTAMTGADPTGFQTYTVTVDDGVNTATDTVVVVDTDPFDLENNCTLFTGNYGASSTGQAATIEYDLDGTRACELGNNEFGLHLCDEVVFESTRLTGTVEVTDAEGDNDWVGLVWGAQDSSNMYSLAWKQSAQNFFGCSTPGGVVVKRIQADAFADLGGADWYCPNDTGNSTFLLGPADTTTVGWAQGQSYTVEIEYTPTQSEITITRDSDDVQIANFTMVDDTFSSGAFGSTTLSQANACVGPLFGACL